MRHVVFAALAALVIGAPVVQADPRPFTFVYDTYPEGKGEWEYEQWVTWRTHTEEDSDYQRVDFRHEFEFGLTENFDLGVYVANWHWEDSTEQQGTHFDSAGVEGIVYLMNPVTDPIGLGLYGEVFAGEDELELEYKLLLHKDVGNWTLAYNLILETEIEGVFHNAPSEGGAGGDDDEDEEGETEVEGVLGHAFGASYSFEGGKWRVGGECVIESVYENWSSYEETTVYAGPNVNYVGGKNCWITVTPMFQLSDVESEADFMVRAVAAIQF
jgi:hypothetical protein